MTEQAKVPAIRFAGFTDPWEQRKLGELVDNIDTGRSVFCSESYGRYPVLGSTSVIGSDSSYDYEGAFLLTARVGANAGNLYRFAGKVKISDNTVFLQAPNSDFLFYLLGHFDLRKLSFGTGQPLVRASELRAVEIDVPKLENEQKSIAEFFDHLDSLITLHQRKYDKLVIFKKSMLEKMFPKDGESVPEIRFAGFTDPWEQRKLGDYVVVSTAKNADGRFNKEDVLSVSGEYGIVNQIAFQGRSFAGSSVLNYGIVNTGDIVYTKSPLNSNPYGIIKVNKGIPGIVSTLYAVYRPQDNVHTNFIQVYFEQHERMNNYMHPLVNKGAKNDMKVTAENALKGVVTFPSREEQVIISEFFDRLDSLITLHQRKLELLQNIKKSLLDKMFV